MLCMENKGTGRPMMAGFIGLKAGRDHERLRAKLYQAMTNGDQVAEDDGAFWATDEKWLAETFDDETRRPEKCTTVQWEDGSPLTVPCKINFKALQTRAKHIAEQQPH